MAEPIINFLQSPSGLLFAFDGLNAIRKWDGLAAAFVEAGVPAPSTNLSMATTGTGDIAGSLYGYYRYKDADGNVSNMSPISSVLQPSGSNGSITAATNAAPISVTSASHGLASTDRVSITGVIGNYAANGVWDVTVVDVNTFTLDNSVGDGDYVSGGTWKEGVSQIDYSSVDTTSDSRVATREILRTLNGDASAVYLDVTDTNPSSGTTFNSTNKDSDLSGAIPLLTLGGDDQELVRHGIPPDYKNYMSHNAGRMVGAGDPIYNRGTVAVTNGNTSVTGHDTNWTEELAGRELYVVGATASYTISSVNEGTQVITLDENYGGSTGAYEKYAIRKSEANRRAVHWSESLLPMSWNPSSNIRMPEDSAAGEVTGTFSHNQFTYITCEGRLFRFTFFNNPIHDGFLSFAPQRGMVNQRCWAIIDDYAYIMDRQGVYKYSGNDLRNVSDEIQDLFDPNSEEKWKINWRWSKYFHTVHDIENETVKFFVSMSGRYPRHALCYQYRLRRWWLEEYPVGITSSTLGLLNGRRQVFLGSEHRTIFAPSNDHLDGPKPGSGTVRGTATSGGLTWIADTAATFPASAEIVNTPIHIVSGKGYGQWRKIVSVSGTTINVDQPWLNTPDSTSVYQIGGIKWTYRTGSMRYTERDGEVNRSIEVTFEPTDNDSRMDLRRYHDRSTTPVNEGRTINEAEQNGIGTEDGNPNNQITTTKENGTVVKNLPDTREYCSDGVRFVSFELVGVTNEERHRVYSMRIRGATP